MSARNATTAAAAATCLLYTPRVIHMGPPITKGVVVVDWEIRTEQG